MSDNIAACQAMYEAFGRGDVPAILEHMADDIALDDWTNNTAVYSGLLDDMTPRFGKDGAVAVFTAMQGIEFVEFRVTNLLAGEGQVAATVSLEMHIKKTNTRIRDEMIHLWSFDAQGKACRFLHDLDTAKPIAAIT